jgi:hypothetical protein
LKQKVECHAISTRRFFTAAESAEIWERWRKGEGLKSIGRAFGKTSSSVLCPHQSVGRYLRQAIQRLPSDKAVVDPRKWYRVVSDTEAALARWLEEYNTAGAYGRIPGQNRDAQFAYNHVVEPRMLRWLISAAGVKLGLVRTARRDAGRVKSMQAASAAIRKVVPWQVVAEMLWSAEVSVTS